MWTRSEQQRAAELRKIREAQGAEEAEWRSIWDVREAEAEAEMIARLREAWEAEAREIDIERARNRVASFMATPGTVIADRRQTPEELQELPGAPNAPAAAVEASSPSADLISTEDASRSIRPVGRVPVQVSQGQIQVTHAIILPI
jgi:hypothetical protein